MVQERLKSLAILTIKNYEPKKIEFKEILPTSCKSQVNAIYCVFHNQSKLSNFNDKLKRKNVHILIKGGWVFCDAIF